MSVKINEEKQMLRKHYIDMRGKMTQTHKESLDIEIASRFLTSDEYMDTELLLIYAATPLEVETRSIIRSALALGKKVALPRCINDEEMKFYFIMSLSELTKGRFKIDEPKAEESRLVNDFDGAVCVVPGLSFDPEGNRLGYGKGYYDRFLKDFSGKKVGLCYNSFIKWSIPADRHDVPVDVLVTDGYVRKTKA